MNKILHLSLACLFAVAQAGSTLAASDVVEQNPASGGGSASSEPVIGQSSPVTRPSAPVVGKSKSVAPTAPQPSVSPMASADTPVAKPKLEPVAKPVAALPAKVPQPSVAKVEKNPVEQSVSKGSKSTVQALAEKKTVVAPQQPAPVAVKPAVPAPAKSVESKSASGDAKVAAQPTARSTLSPGATTAVPAKKVDQAGQSVAVASKVVSAPLVLSAASTSPEIRKEVLSLQRLGLSKPIRLLGDQAESSIDFSFHTLDIVKKLHLKLKYDYSSKLDPKTSKLIVLVNGKSVGEFPLDAEGAPGSFRTLEIDPTLLSEWNHLSFHVASHLKDDPCDDPRSTEKWVRIYHRFSEFDAESFSLPLTNDLALFPMPFFDKHDTQSLKIPFVFSAKPSEKTIKAAGVLSSWFGNLASWRGTNFSTKLGAIPNYDSIVLATAGEHIDGIELPAVTDGYARVSMIDNPVNPVNSRILLIVGRTDKDLVDAVNALTLGKLKLEGSSVAVFNREVMPERALNDAPNWLPTNKQVPVGDLVPADQLKSKGIFVSPLELNVRLPFNLFSTEEQNIPVTLKLQASNGARKLTQIEAVLNGEKFKTVDIKTTDAQGMVAVQTVFAVPTSRMTGKDNLTFNFIFTQTGAEQCAVDGIVYDEIRVDPTSTLDVSALPQYVELPNLSYVAYTGYPFSSKADLSGTVVLLPQPFSEQEISSLLTVIGHLGEKTGYPATGLAVSAFNDAGQYADRDVLVVGTTAHLDGLLQEWKYKIPVNPRGSLQPFPWPVNLFGSWQFFTEDGKGYTDRLGAWFNVSLDLKSRSHTPALIAAFESPLQKKHGVVLVTASNDADLRDATQVLATFERANNFSGDVALLDVQKETVKSYRVAPTYSIGYMSVKERLLRLALHNPWMSFLLIFVLVLFAPEVLFNRLKSRADVRLTGEDQNQAGK